MADVSMEQLEEAIVNLSLMDAAGLVKRLEERLGVSAAAPVAMAAGGAPAVAAVEEQSEFTIVLESAGAEKVKVIKVVREVTGLGLKEAKDLVDTAPKPVKEAIEKKEAEELKKKLEEAGAKVTMK